MHWVHGIHASGQIMRGPVETRPIQPNDGHIAMNTTKDDAEGKCDTCQSWIVMDGRANNVSRWPVAWWKHAQKCHSYS